MLRVIHRIYARLFGYLWLPCPVCGKEFGGHEHVWAIPLIGPTGAMGVCSHACGRKAQKMNDTNGYQWPIRMSIDQEDIEDGRYSV